MTVMNRPVVGYVTCNICQKRASVHEVATGPRKGYLYIRGCDCKINQSPGQPLQTYWRENTEPLPGYEHLFTKGAEVLNTDDQPETEPSGSDDNPQTEAESGVQTETAPKTGDKKQLVIGAAVVLVGGLAALLGLKK